MVTELGDHWQQQTKQSQLTFKDRSWNVQTWAFRHQDACTSAKTTQKTTCSDMLMFKEPDRAWSQLLAASFTYKAVINTVSHSRPSGVTRLILR